MPRADQIDLIGYAGFTSFGDVQANMADDANGNAVITLGDGQSITIDGVNAAALTASNFVFDLTPVTDNAGDMTIGDGAMLPLSGIINNTGTIALEFDRQRHRCSSSSSTASRCKAAVRSSCPTASGNVVIGHQRQTSR